MNLLTMDGRILFPLIRKKAKGEVLMLMLKEVERFTIKAPSHLLHF